MKKYILTYKGLYAYKSTNEKGIGLSNSAILADEFTEEEKEALGNKINLKPFEIFEV